MERGDRLLCWKEQDFEDCRHDEQVSLTFRQPKHVDERGRLGLGSNVTGQFGAAQLSIIDHLRSMCKSTKMTAERKSFNILLSKSRRVGVGSH